MPIGLSGDKPWQPEDDIVYRRRDFTEKWAHAASIVPVETWPLLRHRMETRRVRPYGFEKFLEQSPEYVQRVLDEVQTRGPLTADELPPPEGGYRHPPSVWHRSVPRAVLEVHFGRGVLAVTERRTGFARVYDLAERVLSEEHHGRKVDRDAGSGGCWRRCPSTRWRCTRTRSIFI